MCIRDSGIESLPGTLKEAIDAMEADALVCETLGGHVTTQYLSLIHI